MYTQITETTVEYEFLKIATKLGIDHTLLITTTQRLSKFGVNETDHQLVTLDVLATYISGPVFPRQFINGFVCRMGGTVDTLNVKVKVTNKSVLIQSINMQGLGLGTFMFDVVVRWAKRFDPLLPVETIKVAEVDATEMNQERRNRFYSNFGIMFSDTPNNEGVIGGHSLPMSMSDLKSYDGWKTKMEVHKVDDVLRQQEKTCCDLEQKILAMERSVEAKELALKNRKASNTKNLKVCASIILALAVALWLKW